MKGGGKGRKKKGNEGKKIAIHQKKRHNRKTNKILGKQEEQRYTTQDCVLLNNEINQKTQRQKTTKRLRITISKEEHTEREPTSKLWGFADMNNLRVHSVIVDLGHTFFHGDISECCFQWVNNKIYNKKKVEESEWGKKGKEEWVG